MTNIDKLSLESQSIADQLKAIKKLNDTERTSKTTEIKTQLKKMNDELHAHLSTLDSKTDAQSTNERAKTEALLASINKQNDELLQLGSEVQGNTNAVPTGEEATTVTEHRKKIFNKDERKENATGNLARLGVVAGAVTGVTWLWNKVSGRFSGYSKKESSRWKKMLKGIGIVGGSALALTGGSKLRNKLKERLPDLFGPELSFEDSFTKVQADLNKVDEQKLGIGADMSIKESGEGKVILTSYTQDIEINTKDKTIQGMNVQFKTFPELIHAANLANFCKGSFRGRCTNNEPFHVSDRGGGDMDVDLVEDKNTEFMSGQGLPMGKILGGLSAAGIMYLTRGKLGIKGNIALLAACIMGGHFGLDKNDTLSQICPTLNSDVHKDAFLSYLNRMTIWQKGSDSQDAVKESLIKKEIEAIRQKIKDTPAITKEFDDQSNARNLNAEPDPLNPNKLIITSHSSEKITVTYNQKPKALMIDGYKKRFTNIEEGIRVANLTNFLKQNYKGECNSDTPFAYKGGLKTLGHAGLYVDNDRIDDRSLTEDSLEQHTPTLFANKDAYIKFLNEMKDDGKSLWKA